MVGNRDNKSYCVVHFSGVPHGMVRMEFQGWRPTGHSGRFTSSMGPGAFGDISWGFEEFLWDPMTFAWRIPSTRLLLGLTQLITLKVAF